MNDYDEQLLEGTPDFLTEEQIAEVKAEQEQLEQFAPEVEQTQAAMQTQESQPQATAMGQEAPPPINPNQQRIEEIQQSISPQGFAEKYAAIPTGALDFALDALNLLPGVNIPKLPKFESDVTQTVRELSSIVVPTVALTGAGAGAIGGLAKGSKFLNDPLVKTIGTTAFGAGTGAFVDYTVEINQEDDNLVGSLRKSYPRWFGWIPEDLATLDTDSPDVKRAKNVTEGVYLGVGVDVLLGLNKLLRGLRGVDATTKHVPETEKAKKFFKENVEPEGDVVDVVESSAAARSGALDEVGGYNLSRSVDTDEPIFGYHDLYGYQEQGIRSVDNLGIVGASVDAARIANDVDTVYGRIGNSVSEGALRFSLEGVENQQAIQRGLADVLSAADDYGYSSATGKTLNSTQIKEAGEELAAKFYDMDVSQMRKALADYQTINTTTSVPVLTDEAYKEVTDSLKMYMDDFVNMDYMKAQAYVGTSFAGQISDMAQGMRLTAGTASIERAQEQILDRMEFLMVQKNMSDYSTKRFDNMFSLFNKLSRSDADVISAKETARIEQTIRGEADRTAAALAKIKEEARSTVDNLRQISKEQPEMLEPLMLAYELTDGSVSTITKLNNYLRQSTGVFNKAFIDAQPEIPSVIMKGFYSNLYNSTLSAFGTPIRAGISNAVQLIEKPVRTMAGGLLNGDLKTVRRGWYQYSSVVESLQDSFAYMKQVFKRSGMDPDIIESRENFGLNTSKQLELINKFADAKAAQGEYGPQFMAEIANNMNDLANHPWLRFGNRSMQALDGFTQSMVAMAEAKGRVYDQLTKGGKLPFDEKVGNELYRKVYNEMFDANGVITDKAVKTTSGEITLNLDNAATNALSSMIRYAPMLRPFLLFTKTPINELKLAASYNPFGLFVKDMNAFRLPFDEMPYEDVQQLLSNRGIEVNEFNAELKYNEIRADLKGRKAFGALATTGAVALFLNDSITGNGIYDKQKQALRRSADWKPRSIRLPGGNWVSYDNLGPITSWLSLTVDIMDNMDTLAPNDIGENLRKMGFVLSAAITDKTAFAGLEPLMDILNGNPGALTKWSSSFLTSAAVPGSSQLAELSRLMDPGLKEVEMNVFDLIRNRAPLLKTQLPAKYDWIDGGEVGVPDNAFARIWNVYTPWKVSGKISPEKQFLMDIEYDARPSLAKSDAGVKLTAAERAEITNIMGRDGLFKAGIQRVMRSEEGKAFRKRYKEAVANGLDVDLNKFEMLHILLDRELRQAKRMAMAVSPSRSDISRRGYIKQVESQYLRRGDQESAKRFIDYMKKFSY